MIKPEGFIHQLRDLQRPKMTRAVSLDLPVLEFTVTFRPRFGQHSLLFAAKFAAVPNLEERGSLGLECSGKGVRQVEVGERDQPWFSAMREKSPLVPAGKTAHASRTFQRRRSVPNTRHDFAHARILRRAGATLLVRLAHGGICPSNQRRGKLQPELGLGEVKTISTGLVLFIRCDRGTGGGPFGRSAGGPAPAAVPLARRGAAYPTRSLLSIRCDRGTGRGPGQ